MARSTERIEDSPVGRVVEVPRIDFSTARGGCLVARYRIRRPGGPLDWGSAFEVSGEGRFEEVLIERVLDVAPDPYRVFLGAPDDVFGGQDAQSRDAEAWVVRGIDRPDPGRQSVYCLAEGAPLHARPIGPSGAMLLGASSGGRLGLTALYREGEHDHELPATRFELVELASGDLLWSLDHKACGEPHGFDVRFAPSARALLWQGGRAVLIATDTGKTVPFDVHYERGWEARLRAVGFTGSGERFVAAHRTGAWSFDALTGERLAAAVMPELEISAMCPLGADSVAFAAGSLLWWWPLDGAPLPALHALPAGRITAMAAIAEVVAVAYEDGGILLVPRDQLDGKP